jgi:hypothetical protein
VLILVAAVSFALVARLVGSHVFSSLLALVLAVLPWIVVQRAEAIRHPVDPIGSSNSGEMQTYYLLIVLTVAGLAVGLIAHLWLSKELIESPAIQAGADSPS